MSSMSACRELLARHFVCFCVMGRVVNETEQHLRKQPALRFPLETDRYQRHKSMQILGGNKHTFFNYNPPEKSF